MKLIHRMRRTVRTLRSFRVPAFVSYSAFVLTSMSLVSLLTLYANERVQDRLDSTALIYAVVVLLFVWSIANFLYFLFASTPPRVSALFALLSAAVIILLYGGLFTAVGLKAPGGDPAETHAFRDGLYFSVITCTSVGYGDLHPPTQNGGRVLAASEALLGYVYMALAVGLSIQLLGERARKKS